DDTIMADMRIDHEVVIVAYHRFHVIRGAAVDRDELAKGIAVADFQAGRLVVVLKMLRVVAEDGASVDGVAASHGQWAKEVSTRPDHAVGADLDLAFDDGMSADFDMGGKLGKRRNDGGRMDA